jgi:hypothetical protein
MRRRTIIAAWPWPPEGAMAHPLGEELTRLGTNLEALEGQQAHDRDARLIDAGDAGRVFVLHDTLPEMGLDDHAYLLEALTAAGMDVFAESDGREGSRGERAWYPKGGKPEELDTLDRSPAVSEDDLFGELAKAGCPDTTLAAAPDATLANAVRALFPPRQPLPAAVAAAIDSVISEANSGR